MLFDAVGKALAVRRIVPQVGVQHHHLAGIVEQLRRIGGLTPGPEGPFRIPAQKLPLRARMAAAGGAPVIIGPVVVVGEGVAKQIVDGVVEVEEGFHLRDLTSDDLAVCKGPRPWPGKAAQRRRAPGRG